MKLALENIKIIDHKIYDESGIYRGEMLYEYVRGSQLYNTSLPDGKSDLDTGGIYIMPEDSLIGLGLEYQSEIKDASSDYCIWEIGRFFELAMTSNPSVLEALFVPEDKVIYEHPVITELKSHRIEFLTKKCFAPFGGYATSQIKKAQGQNKKIHWDAAKMERKSPMEFCYTFKNQGSTPMEKWLEKRGLQQRNCGCVKIPNMPNMYGVYYDFGQHMALEGVDNVNDLLDYGGRNKKFWKFIAPQMSNSTIDEWFKKNREPKGGYCGIISPNEDSNEIRLSSIPEKDARPICFMSYNANGYSSHCREYREYEEWKKKRNVARYESNLEGEKSGNPDMQYDVKNMYHCFRLMAMGKEIAEGKGIILDRTGIDRDFLLEVRTRKYGYSELMERMFKLKREMDDAIGKSDIPEDIDTNELNKILLNIRKEFKTNQIKT